MKKLTLMFVAMSLVILVINFTHAQTDTKKPPLIPVYYADGKVAADAHIVIGQILVPAGSSSSPINEEFPVTLTDAAAFTSADSYRCFASKPFGASIFTGGLFRIIDGGHFAFRTGRVGFAWQQDFFCIGN
jgi:hypothetical protein